MLVNHFIRKGGDMIVGAIYVALPELISAWIDYSCQA